MKRFVLVVALLLAACIPTFTPEPTATPTRTIAPPYSLSPEETQYYQGVWDLCLYSLFRANYGTTDRDVMDECAVLLNDARRNDWYNNGPPLVRPGE
jgi:hypothetical protein